MTATTRRVTRKTDTWRHRLTYSDGFLDAIAGAAELIIRCYLPLLRIRRVYHPDFPHDRRDRLGYAFWHGRLLLLVPAFGHWHVVIMTDLSWAGEILARILRRFGFHVARGSSKRGGFRGIIEMKHIMDDARVGAALAVDGPRGPYRRSKPGLSFLADRSGYGLAPLTVAADRYWIVPGTWDRFMIPKPFARCVVAMGAPLPHEQIEKIMAPENLDRWLDQWTNYWDGRLGGSTGGTLP